MPDTKPRSPFKRAVLGLNGGPIDERVVHLGCQLAKSAGGELVAVHVVEVDWTHDLSEDVASQSASAAAVLDMAEEIARQYKIKLQSYLLQARDVAAALVDEAIEQSVDAVLVGLPYRKRFGGDFAIGRTVPYVFSNAPCEVIVVREAVATSAQRSAAGVAAWPESRS